MRSFAWIGVMDQAGTFEYVNAGHNRPLVRRADGTVEKVTGKGGRFLGMFEDAAYRVRLRFSDDGRAYNPLSHLDLDTYAPIEDRPVSVWWW